MLISTNPYTSYAFVDAAVAATHRIAAAAHTLVARACTFLSKSAEELQREREEAYLANAVDCYDLEYRIRELDCRNALQPHWMVWLPR